MPSGSAAYVSATIQSDATAIGGNSLRLVDTGWGGNPIFMTPDSIGSLSAGVETEVLISWKLGSLATTGSGYFRAVFPLLRALSDGSRYNGLGIQNTAGPTYQLRSWYFQGSNDWNNIGSARNVTASLSTGEWWWVRMRVTAAGAWSWRAWEGDFSSEPGSWDVSGVSQTSQTSGYVGFGSGGSFTSIDPIDVQYFSVGTAGDSAPGPSGGGGIVYGVPLRQPRPNVLLRM